MNNEKEQNPSAPQKVYITSKNPVKVEAVVEALRRSLPYNNFEFISVSVESGVSDQPMTREETSRGSSNRVHAAMVAHPDGHYYVGIEGGVEKDHHGLGCFAYVSIGSPKSAGSRNLSTTSTGTFYLPHQVADLVINQGMELGDADDIVFKGENTKQKNGAIGLLTDNLVTRKDFYIPTVIMAMIPFLKPNLY